MKIESTGEGSTGWLLRLPVWVVRATLGHPEGAKQTGGCPVWDTWHLWNKEMADVRRCLKLRRAVEINILVSFCPAQFSRYLLSDNNMSIILRHQEIQ